MQFTTSRAERTSVGLYAFGTILSYYMIMSYLQLYMTDIGISAVAVGIIFMFAKVWDAVNDPIFGVMVDKVTLKGGKYRPWLRISSIANPLDHHFALHRARRCFRAGKNHLVQRGIYSLGYRLYHV